MNRRQLLQAGTASILIAGSLSACSSGPSASEAWRTGSDPYDDPRLTVLASGILAPSPHNRQPWLIELSENNPNRMTLYSDLTRLLPETDPPNRQILIGLGAFIEAVSLAATGLGRSLTVEAFPQGVPNGGLDANPVAYLTLGPKGSAELDPLFTFLRDRRTNRLTFEDRAVPNDVLATIGAAISSGVTRWSSANDAVQCSELRGICQQGWRVEMGTPHTHEESVALTRIGRSEIAANPDGISLSGPAISAFSALGMLTRGKMRDPDSRAFSGTHDFYSDLIDSARSFGWLMTMDNRRTSQLAAGRDWIRLQLAATRAGVAFQPLSQVLQEFPEMSALYADLHRALSVTKPARIQGLFRLGYAKAPNPSPRWPWRTRLIDAPYE
jgi:hypothetical protein